MNAHDEHGVRRGRTILKKDHRDLLAALASGLVAALALATSTYNVYLQRQQVRAAVWPKLAVRSTWGSEGQLSVSVSNRGIGPADVRRLRVFVDGQASSSWPKVVRTVTGKPETAPPEVDSVETTLNPGLELNFLTIADRNAAYVFSAGWSRITMEFCYCSALDECWTLTSPGGEPDKTESAKNCIADRVPFVPMTKEEREDVVRERSRAPAEAAATTSH